MARSLLLVLLAAAACGGKPSAPSKSTPVVDPAPQPTTRVVEAHLTNDDLVAFVRERFAAAVQAGTLTLDWGMGGIEEQLPEELQIMGITTEAELAAIVPSDYETRGLGAADETNIGELIRDLLIIHDVRRYFTKAWRGNWAASGPEDFPAAAAYGVDFSVMVEVGLFPGR